MLNAPLLALSLTCSLAFSFGNSGGASAGSSAIATWAGPARGSVDVDTSAVGEEGPALQRRIDSRAGDILLANEVLPAKDVGDAHFVVTVRPAGEDGPGWLANVSVKRDGTSIDGTSRAIDCKLCTEGELVDKVAAALEELIPAHASAPEGAAGHDEGDGAAPADHPLPPDTGPKEKKIGPLGFAGIGVGALGLVGIGVGAGLMAKDPEVQLGTNPAKQKDFKGPGAATLAVGGVLLVTGVALIVVDQIKRKKAANTAALPYFGRDGAGIAFVTRF